MKVNVKLVMLLIVVMSLTTTCIGKDLPINIISVTGKVEIQEAGTDVWIKAEKNAILKTGDIIKTGDDGEAILAFSEGNSLKVSPFSLITISKAVVENNLETSEFNLEKGRLLAKAKKMKPGESFNVKTPSAVAGVRGTDFLSQVGEDKKAMFAVLSGELSVFAEGIEVAVTANMKVDVEMGAPPSEPIAIPAEMLQELKQEIQEIKAVIESAAIGLIKKEVIEEKAPETISEQTVENVVNDNIGQAVEQNLRNNGNNIRI